MFHEAIRLVPAATMADYHDLNDFGWGVTVGAEEMGCNISDVSMKL